MRARAERCGDPPGRFDFDTMTLPVIERKRVRLEPSVRAIASVTAESSPPLNVQPPRASFRLLCSTLAAVEKIA